tara:strand:+ start:4829 stop:4945 length:117 start_codon:yes stop_codon:yes gene_type:complete
MIKKVINWFKKKYWEWKTKKEIKKKLEEIKKRDPFIYD